MIQKLIILGLLKKNPASGYDIRKFMDKELGIFSQLEAQSIYYSLKKMEKEGLIERKELKGRTHLKKYTYYITAKGERSFLELCKEVLLSQSRPFIELDIALYFLPFLDKKEIMPFLRLRLRFLERVKNWLIDKQKEFKEAPANISLIIDHHSKLVAAEKDFLKGMVKTVKYEKDFMHSL